MITANEISFMCLIFAALFIFSGIFSASETAFFNLKSYDKVDFKTKELLQRPKRLLIFLLTGNTIINIVNMQYTPIH